MKKPKILGVITARGGSKGIPHKNIKKLGGKPLITWTIESARESKFISHLIVSTDDEKIIKVAKKSGVDVPFKRPAELALDNTPHTPVIKHAVSFMEDKLGIKFDYVVILQPTSPFRLAVDIDESLKKMIKVGADSVVTIKKAEKKNHPMKMKKIAGDWLLNYLPENEKVRRQDIKEIYQRNSALYAMKRDYVMSRKNNELSFGSKTTFYEMPKERSIDIDEPLDFVIAEAMVKMLRKK